MIEIMNRLYYVLGVKDTITNNNIVDDYEDVFSELENNAIIIQRWYRTILINRRNKKFILKKVILSKNKKKKRKASKISIN